MELNLSNDSVTLMASFVIAFTGCQLLSKFNSKFRHVFTVPCMGLHNLKYQHLPITRLGRNPDLVCDLDHVHNWLFLDTGQSLLNETSLLHVLYHEIDRLKILGHLHHFSSFARDSRNICLTSPFPNVVKAPSRRSYLIRALYKCSICIVNSTEWNENDSNKMK